MKKLNEKQKLLIVAGSAVLLCGLAGAGVWWAKDLAQQERDSVAAVRTQIQAAEAKIAKIPALERDVIILRECVHEYVKILPEERELSNFLRATNQFARQAGVVLDQAVPGKASAAGGSSKFDRYTYSLQFKGTLWQFMRFTNFFESYERFVNVRNFSLTADNRRKGSPQPGEDAIHQVQMTLETYVYTGTQKGKDVQIPNYANKKANLREDIFRNLTGMRRDRYEFKDQRGRRDIFVDPREPSGPVDKQGVPLLHQKKIIDEFTAQVQQLKGISQRAKDPAITIIERMQLERTLKQSLEEMRTKIADVNDKGLISFLPYRLHWTKQVVEQVDGLANDLARGAASNDRYLSELEIKQLLDTMRAAMINGDWEVAKQAYENSAERLDVPRTDPRHRAVVGVMQLYERTKAALEFSQLKLEIKGVAVSGNGRSGLILNGEVLQEGEYVNDNLLIKSVGREQVEFVFKGFTIVKTF
ncbi:MAG: type 4a pilus biogenesis protein PilO [Planctomycetes bacterium]|nr:type 4a pilus biogenesis protein PilO [Planctomycetota bacterium]